MAVAVFVEALQQLSLLEPTQREQLATLERQFPDLKELTQELVRQGWLTQFQIDALTAGEGAKLLLDQYVLLELLGQGGMGTVYKARQRTVKRLVALKVIRPDVLKTDGAIERFQREAEIAARLTHPNIVLLYDARQVDGVHFLVMEYIEGTDLGKLVAREGRLGVRQACGCIRQAAMGLQHAHEQGLVHRDVKPHNLMLTNTGVVKVMDLGLARTVHAAAENAASAGLTGSGVMMGTADYLAPEQAMDARTVDIRADIYALGSTLYHLLAGFPPFPGGTIANKIANHMYKYPQPIETCRTDVPTSLGAVVRRMMAKQPELRYATPADVALALEPFEQGTKRRSATDVVVPMGLTPPGATDAFTVVRGTEPAAEDGPSYLRKRPRSRWLAAAFVFLMALAALEAWLLLGRVRPTPSETPVVVVTPTNTEPTRRPPEPATFPKTTTETKAPPPKDPTPGPPPRDTRPDPTPATKDPNPDPPQALSLDLGKGVKLTLVPIKAGSFRMGSPDSDSDAYVDEKPAHKVTISKDFYLGKYLVTQEQYQQVMGSNPSLFAAVPKLDTRRFPVEKVSWEEAKQFCDKLSVLTKKRVELPTEAEWEYACRAGTETPYYCGDKLLAENANFGETLGRTTEVGKYPASPWGLYDMAGNVWQWCADGKRRYTAEAQTDPLGPGDKSDRVLRGGSWVGAARTCRSACRNTASVTQVVGSNGFRVIVRPE